MKPKSLNILLWILQIVLAMYFIIGAVYMMGHYQFLVKPTVLNTLPQVFWILLGVLQIIFSLGLIVPAIARKNKLIAASAMGLAIIAVLGSILYAAYVGVGVLWSIVPAALLAFVAYKRWG